MSQARVLSTAGEVRINRFLAQVYLLMTLGLIVTAFTATWVNR
jgi:FtsH-binding integral membrane protein